jgi:hypothetical protein
MISGLRWSYILQLRSKKEVFMKHTTYALSLLVSGTLAIAACTLNQAPPSTREPSSMNQEIEPPSTEEIKPVVTEEISTQVELPPVVNPFEVTSIVLDPAGCTWDLPAGSGEAILQPSDLGFVLWTFNPFGLGLLGDGEGNFTWTFDAPPVGFGETEERKLEVSDISRDGNKVVLTLEETRFTEDAKDGCTQKYTVTFTFSDPQVLDFLSAMIYDGSGGVKLENPDLEVSDDYLSLGGELVGSTSGRSFHIWIEVSGTEIGYTLAEIFPRPDGTFLVKIYLDIPSGTFIILQVTSNGVTIASTSGDAPSD